MTCGGCSFCGVLTPVAGFFQQSGSGSAVSLTGVEASQLFKTSPRSEYPESVEEVIGMLYKLVVSFSPAGSRASGDPSSSQRTVERGRSGNEVLADSPGWQMNGSASLSSSANDGTRGNDGPAAAAASSSAERGAGRGAGKKEMVRL